LLDALVAQARVAGYARLVLSVNPKNPAQRLYRRCGFCDLPSGNPQVDEHGNPVRPGIRAAKMYVTNLVNHVQPMIRYELTDEATLLEDPCPCGSSMRRIDDIDDLLNTQNG
jgi:hypothetical protein